jgi:hypothetical protein
MNCISAHKLKKVPNRHPKNRCKLPESSQVAPSQVSSWEPAKPAVVRK